MRMPVRCEAIQALAMGLWASWAKPVTRPSTNATVKITNACLRMLLRKVPSRSPRYEPRGRADRTEAHSLRMGAWLAPTLGAGAGLAGRGRGDGPLRLGGSGVARR